MEHERAAILEDVVAPPALSIADAIAQLDKAGTGGLVLCHPDGQVAGLLSDGDIRRAVLRRMSLADPCGSIATQAPVVARAPIEPAEALALMLQHDINHLPVVDDAGVLIDFLLRKNLVVDAPGDLSAVVMAGGFGKRLMPLTENVPKPMLPVGERPLLERTIDQLRGAGIREVHLTTHYLPESIVGHFGDGEAFGVHMSYATEDEPMGTAGGLRLIPRPVGPFLVINGDILTRVSYQEMLRFHRKHGATLTVGLRAHEVEVPFGVVEADDARITDLTEKPSIRLLVNAGIYLLEPGAWDHIPAGRRFDMTDLIRRLLDEGEVVVGFPIIEYWQDVGRHEDYRRAQEDVRDGRFEEPRADPNDVAEASDSPGAAMHALARRLFPLNRSITGDGVRETLRILGEHIPLEIHEVPTGTRAFDWTVPPEWSIRDAYILDEHGDRIVDFQQNNLHLVAYSVPVDATLSLAELQPHLYSLDGQPTAIPYVTSYYERRWGFCLSHAQRQRLQDGLYRVVIDSELKDGSLTYGELIIPGATPSEVFLSTYVCHPSMGNNELSGPVVTTWLAKWIASRPRRYTYRLVFIPETIGSLVYLSRHLDTLKANVVAGFNVTCVGDDRSYSYLPSRYGGTVADRVALHTLKARHPEFIRYSFLDRGSDERQYCSPGIDLPVVSVMRTKYHEFPEYHTSLDDLTVVTPAGLEGGYNILRDCLAALEANRTYRSTSLGEPHLGGRGLFPTLGTTSNYRAMRTTMDLLAYADGTHDLVEIGDIIGVPMTELQRVAEQLLEHGLLAEEPGRRATPA